MTVREIISELRSTLTPAVGEGEARAMANIIIEDVKGYTPSQLIINGDRTLMDETVQRVRKIAQRIVDGEPMQYVLGIARFRGRDFKVMPGVLIPRPETGQLVDMIVDDNNGRQDLKVLDLGTGSGCIAISLALDMDFAEVDAIDFSQVAVNVASENSLRLRAKVGVSQSDIFALSQSVFADKRYDIIVSNPPYIMRKESAGMDDRVKAYEPDTALFVPDDKPIEIYRAITEYASAHLAPNGALYLEINPLCADELKRMIESYGFRSEVIRDFRGTLRFIKATK